MPHACTPNLSQTDRLEITVADLTDAFGRALDGNDDGQPGGNFSATFDQRGPTVDAVALARVAGETAPLLFTTPGNHFWSHSLSEPIASLPVQIYVNAIGPYDEWHRQAWAGALVLLCIAMAVNVGARLMTGRRTPHLIH